MDDSERRKQLAGIRDVIQKGAFQPMGMNEAKRLLEKHLRAEKAKNDTVTLPRAEYEEMRKEYDTLRARVAELGREVEAKRQDHEAACCIIADMHRAAVGQIAGPRRGVVDDVEDIHHMAECAAIMAVCGYFSRMRGPDEWCCVSKDGFTKRRVGTRQLAEMHSREGWTITPLYAGTAPVPAAQMDNPDVMARATAYARDIVTWLHRDHYADNTRFEPFDDLLGLLSQIDNMVCGWKELSVAAICNAYESGVGHRGRPTANVNPYREGTPEHEAYAIGARGEAAQAETKVADDVGSDEWSAVVRELMAVASYRPSCQKYVIERCRCFECVNERAVSLLSRNAAMLAAKAKEGGK